MLGCQVRSGTSNSRRRFWMKAILHSLVFSLLATMLAIPQARAQQPAAASASNPVVERVGDTAFIRVSAPSFHSLTPRQQELAYWLTQACIAIDPIIYDQFSAYGLRQKRLLEEIMAHSAELDPESRVKNAAHAKLFWATRGKHNNLRSQKFLPEF